MTKQSLSPKMSVFIQVPAGKTSQDQHQNTTCAGVERTNVSRDEKRFKTFIQKQTKGGKLLESKSPYSNPNRDLRHKRGFM